MLLESLDAEQLGDDRLFDVPLGSDGSSALTPPPGGTIQHRPQANACNRAKSGRLPMISSDRCGRPCGRPTAVEAYPEAEEQNRWSPRHER
jgi:hypothetical protein